MEWLPITCRGFRDVPRSVVVVVDGVGHLLRSGFRDEHPDRYRVVVLGPGAVPDPPSGGRGIGAVSVADVVFDPTRRRSVDARLRTAPAALPR